MKRRRTSLLWLIAAFVSLGCHVAVIAVLAMVWELLPERKLEKSKETVVELVSLAPSSSDSLRVKTPEEILAEPEPEQTPDQPDPDEVPDGQIVEISPPENPMKPDEADYLAEVDSSVPEETKSLDYTVNPEILAPQYSEIQAIEMQGQPVPDLGMTEPAHGATAGQTRFDPQQNGLLSTLPSKWSETNMDGPDNPVPAALKESYLAGSPSNDKLNERAGDRTALDAQAYPYASYYIRVRRLVQFYWTQNLDNLPPSVKLARPEYTTTVNATLDGNGSLRAVDITDESGSTELDDCLVRAFRVAGPYPNPPAGLIGKDGLVHLDNLGFTVTVGMAQVRYEGVDPRAGVKFPGLLKAPR